MKIEMGESLFYSWLRHVKECHIVQTNWKISSQWNLLHEDELQIIKDKTDDYFQKNYNYNIYKKSSSLKQIIQQGESDVVGISFQEGTRKTYAVDVAFHESGLNYGGKDTTVMKITNKCIRTAMCLYGYMDVSDAEIIFASPKINKSILDIAIKCVEEAEEVMRKLGYDFTFRLIANQDFQKLILKPILLVSNGVADTNELFLRSYQMLQMFQPKNHENVQNSSASLDEVEGMNELKIGKYARIAIIEVLKSGRVSAGEIQKMLTAEYSKETFDLQFPVLAKADSAYMSERYYSDKINIDGQDYVLCSQWYETKANNDRPYLERWVRDHRENI